MTTAALRAKGLWPGGNGAAPQGRPRARETRYDIRDAGGELVAIHVRRDHPDGSKSFTWERPGGGHGLDGLRVDRLPLYGSERLAELPDGALVAVCEGERAARALLNAGFAAVGTVTGAASAPGLDALRPLVRLRPILWADNDAAGQQHMERVAARLHALGATPRVVSWPDAPPKGDAADAVAAGADVRALLDAARPWEPEAQGDGAALLDEVRDAIVRYVALPSAEAADALALWAAATHAQPAWEHATRLVVKSPLRRCGKTRLLEVVAALCYKPLLTANISPAALVRSIDEADPPTLFHDEADVLFHRRRGGERSEVADDLVGLLNAGHARGWAYIRWDPKTRQLERCSTFAMVALASIGDLPDTIEDRAIAAVMQRRAPSEEVAPLRQRDLPALRALGEGLHTWLRAYLDELRHADPALPVTDRAADTWAPLVAVADLAGGEWPSRARRACLALVGQEQDPEDAGELLLRDLRVIFDEDGADRLPTPAILEGLRGLEESPWASWAQGRGLEANGLARLLKPYGVRSQKWRGGALFLRGYLREDLEPVWQRYLGTSAATAATPPQTPENESAGPVAGSKVEAATEPPQASAPFFESVEPRFGAGCGGVAADPAECAEDANLEPEDVDADTLAPNADELAPPDIVTEDDPPLPSGGVEERRRYPCAGGCGRLVDHQTARCFTCALVAGDAWLRARPAQPASEVSE